MFFHLISRVVGWIARLWCPGFVVSAFAKFVGISVSEAEFPLSHYDSLDAFFTRGLCSELRPIGEGIVSPVDGLVLISGRLVRGQILQAKGLSYSLDALLGREASDDFLDGYFVTVYLSPRDCHRIFSPVSGRVVSDRLIPGRVLPVREPYISRSPNLYVENTIDS